MEAQKKSAAKAKNAKKGGFNAFVVILLSFVISISFFNFVLGAPSNFDEAGHPINLLGTMYLGGFVVPIIQGLLVLVLILSVERLIALAKAKGSKSVDKFVKELKAALEADKFRVRGQKLSAPRVLLGSCGKGCPQRHRHLPHFYKNAHQHSPLPCSNR